MLLSLPPTSEWPVSSREDSQTRFQEAHTLNKKRDISKRHICALEGSSTGFARKAGRWGTWNRLVKRGSNEMSAVAERIQLKVIIRSAGL